MTSLLRHLSLIAGIFALAVLLALATSAVAQQINPTAEAVSEEQLLNAAKRIVGECSLPDRKACTLDQPRGRDWQWFYQTVLRLVGGLAILGLIAVVIAFYLIRGPVRMSHGRTGRVMVRFSAFERFVHWVATVCFIILALSGLNITFGKDLILPLVGPEAFSALTRWGQSAHNYLSFPFTLSGGIFLMWIAGTCRTTDIRDDGRQRFRRSIRRPICSTPARNRSTGSSCSAAWRSRQPAASGVPVRCTGIVGMQLAQLCIFGGAVVHQRHGVPHLHGRGRREGAFEGMWDGTVGENWAKQHH